MTFNAELGWLAFWKAKQQKAVSAQFPQQFKPSLKEKRALLESFTSRQ